VGSKGRAPGQEDRGKAPLKLKLLAFGRSLKAANLPTLKKLKRKKSDTICVIFAKNEV